MPLFFRLGEGAGGGMEGCQERIECDEPSRCKPGLTDFVFRDPGRDRFKRTLPLLLEVGHQEAGNLQAPPWEKVRFLQVQEGGRGAALVL